MDALQTAFRPLVYHDGDVYAQVVDNGTPAIARVDVQAWNGMAAIAWAPVGYDVQHGFAVDDSGLYWVLTDGSETVLWQYNLP